jgi:cytosine/adenosine deaminase-related metal-dependent hydrolase
MNQEASRAARWGPMDDADALAFVTRNPAQQLGVGDRVGRLEVGMDADFVLWSARPLSTAAVCQQTWVDGVKRFDIKEDQAARSATREERARLLAKVRSSKELGKKEADPSAGEAGEHAEEYEAGVCTGAWECGGEQRR